MTDTTIEIERTWTGGPAASGAQGTFVFVNSLATSWALWDGIVRELPEGWDVLRYDQRDRGHRGASPFGLDDLVADLIEVLDVAGVARAHVVGVSLGGMVALRAAATSRERFLSVTAMCCAARFSRDIWVERAAAVRRDGLAPLVPGILDRWFTRRFQAENPAEVAAYRAMLSASDTTGYAHASDLLADADIREDLRSISLPALIIAGEADPANPPSDLEAIAERIPGARLEVLPEVAHLAPAIAPAALARLVAAHAGSARAGAAPSAAVDRATKPEGTAP